MTDPLPQPNIIIVKIDNKLVSFPLSADGIISDGQEFESDYELEDYQIIFSQYNDDTATSVELCRFAHLRDEKETSVKVLYEENELKNFVEYIVKNEL